MCAWAAYHHHKLLCEDRNAGATGTLVGCKHALGETGILCQGLGCKSCRTARNHGLQTVGLPSRQAAFEPDRHVTWHGRRGWWHDAGEFHTLQWTFGSS